MINTEYIIFLTNLPRRDKSRPLLLQDRKLPLATLHLNHNKSTTLSRPLKTGIIERTSVLPCSYSAVILFTRSWVGGSITQNKSINCDRSRQSKRSFAK